MNWEQLRKEYIVIDYNEKLLNDLINYNKQRFFAFKEQKPFVYDPQFEKLLNARIQKVGRIKKRLLYLLIRYKYIWFCTFTFNNKFINKCERTKPNIFVSN